MRWIRQRYVRWGVVVGLVLVAWGLYLGREHLRPTLSTDEQPMPLGSQPVAPSVVTEGSPLPADVSGRLAGVLGMTRQSGYGDRSRAVRALGLEIPQDEVAALYRFLAGELGPNPGLDSMEINALKNDIVNVLRSQTKRLEDLAERLVAMYQDTAQDPVWRDYCVQQMGAWLPDAGQDDQKLLLDELWAVSAVVTSGTAGTALLALFKNVPSKLVDGEAVSKRAQEITLNKAACHPAQVTAIQVCAELGNLSVLPTARQIMAGEPDVQMRMSALAAIGTLGEATDRSLLESYSTNQEVRLRIAAQSALQRLDARSR